MSDNTAKVTATRIYVCQIGDEVRLVRAQNRIQALNHIARSKIDVRIADQDTLVNALTSGLKVETAK